MQYSLILKDHYLSNKFDTSKLDKTGIKIVEQLGENMYLLEFPDHWDIIHVYVNDSDMVSAIKLSVNNQTILETKRHPFCPNLVRTEIAKLDDFDSFLD